MANVLLHLVLGLALAVAFALLLKREPELRRPLIAPAVFFAIALAFALYLVWVGNLREHRWVLNAHIVSSLLGVVALLPFLFRLAPDRRASAHAEPQRRERGAACRRAAARDRDLRQGQPEPERPHRQSVADARVHGRRRRRPELAVLPVVGEDQRRRHHPVELLHGLGDAAATCHKDIYEQWNSSAHHFASFNNQFYRKSIEYMQDVVGTAAEQMVRRLPRPRGVLQRPVRDADQGADRHAGSAGRPRAARRAMRSRTSTASMGNGGFTIEYPPLHELMTSKNQYIRAMDSFMTYLNPEPHRKTFMKPFMRATRRSSARRATRCTSTCR